MYRYINVGEKKDQHLYFVIFFFYIKKNGIVLYIKKALTIYLGYYSQLSKCG